MVLWLFLATLLALVAVASPFAGVWWFGLAVVPLLAHAVARTVGTLREGHLF